MPRHPDVKIAIVAGPLALAVALSVFWGCGRSAELVPKSIAVLPFDSLSPDRNNAELADDIRGEILTRLATIADLKVISHASMQHYKRQPRDLRQIANQVGVANVLEGSVEKAGDQVRVSVKLFNAQSDHLLWAQTFDRNLTEIPSGIASEITRRIAESLQIDYPPTLHNIAPTMTAWGETGEREFNTSPPP